VDISRSIYEQRNIYNLREKKLIQKIATSNKKATKQSREKNSPSSKNIDDR